MELLFGVAGRVQHDGDLLGRGQEGVSQRRRALPRTDRYVLTNGLLLLYRSVPVANLQTRESHESLKPKKA